jgi:hypothetical protein
MREGIFDERLNDEPGDAGIKGSRLYLLPKGESPWPSPGLNREIVAGQAEAVIEAAERRTRG